MALVEDDDEEEEEGDEEDEAAADCVLLIVGKVVAKRLGSERRRSQGAPLALLELICFRCAKRMATIGWATCCKQANRNYSYCWRLNKLCQVVSL